LGADLSGNFVNSQTLVITIDVSTGVTPPVIGEFTMTVNLAANLQGVDEDGNANTLASKSVSPPLVGTFGDKEGPFIRSLVALDPFGNTGGFGDGDTITVTFSEATNEPDPTPTVPGLSKDDLDTMFTFSQVLGTNVNAYTGEFIDPLILVITIDDTFETGISEASVGVFRLKVNLAANLRDAADSSLPSVAESPPLSGTFVTKDGPTILSIVAADADGIVDGIFNTGF